LEKKNNTVEKNIRILLVDDDEDEYVIIRGQLSEISDMSFEISWAEGYSQAHNIIKNNQFDVCLVDYLLGKNNGIELIRDFKRKGVNIPFILLTGKGDHNLDLKAMLEGAVDYLEKEGMKPSQLDRSIRYAVQNQKIIAELTLARERQAELAKKILESQEKEREFVARDLHDSIGTGLSAVHFALGREIDKIEKSGTSTINLDGLNRINDMLVDIIEETRRISGNLRPSILDNLGVLPAISSFIRQFRKVYQDINFESEFEIDEKDIPEKLKIIIYRIVQEGLTNAAKHSQATQVELLITNKENCIELDISDNGKGFDIDTTRLNASENNNMGLMGMVERVILAGGEIDIITKPGDGTKIQVFFPFLKPEKILAEQCVRG
jgi:signal transduction histidine kinase